MSANIDENAVNEAQNLLEQVMIRSMTDQGFRQALLGNPRGALAEYTDIREGFRIVFVENQADATYVLPDPVDDATELNETELEAVAGGFTRAALVGMYMLGAGLVSTARAAADAFKTLGDDCRWTS